MKNLSSKIIFIFAVLPIAFFVSILLYILLKIFGGQWAIQFFSILFIVFILQVITLISTRSAKNV